MRPKGSTAMDAGTTTGRLYALLCDFAIDAAGVPDGLTVFELRRAWVIRHRCALPAFALHRLVATGMLRRAPRKRTCVVSGHYIAPYLPYAIPDEEITCN